MRACASITTPTTPRSSSSSSAQPLTQEPDNSLESIATTNLEDLLPQRGSGSDGLEADCDCVGISDVIFLLIVVY